MTTYHHQVALPSCQLLFFDLTAAIHVDKSAHNCYPVSGNIKRCYTKNTAPNRLNVTFMTCPKIMSNKMSTS